MNENSTDQSIIAVLLSVGMESAYATNVPSISVISRREVNIILEVSLNGISSQVNVDGVI